VDGKEELFKHGTKRGERGYWVFWGSTKRGPQLNSRESRKYIVAEKRKKNLRKRK
jgi:hypothetical protein